MGLSDFLIIELSVFLYLVCIILYFYLLCLKDVIKDTVTDRREEFKRIEIE